MDSQVEPTARSPLRRRPLIRNRQTKIVATLGPATSTPEQVEAIFLAGADVFRLNFSHGSQQDHAERIRILRTLEATYRRPIAVLADLQGPKLRLGSFRDGPISLTEGQSLRLDTNPEPGDSTRAPVPHPEVFESMAVGHHLLLDDGKVRLSRKAALLDAGETDPLEELIRTLNDRPQEPRRDDRPRSNFGGRGGDRGGDRGRDRGHDRRR